MSYQPYSQSDFQRAFLTRAGCWILKDPEGTMLGTVVNAVLVNDPNQSLQSVMLLLDCGDQIKFPRYYMYKYKYEGPCELKTHSFIPGSIPNKIVVTDGGFVGELDIKHDTAGTPPKTLYTIEDDGAEATNTSLSAKLAADAKQHHAQVQKESAEEQGERQRRADALRETAYAQSRDLGTMLEAALNPNSMSPAILAAQVEALTAQVRELGGDPEKTLNNLQPEPDNPVVTAGVIVFPSRAADRCEVVRITLSGPSGRLVIEADPTAGLQLTALPR